MPSKDPWGDLIDKHVCRESEDPRHAGYCPCGKKIDPLTLEPLGPIETEYHKSFPQIEYEEGNYARARDQELQEVNPAIQRDAMREFDTGATRDSDTEKLDYEGFLSPAALKAFAEYMHRHRIQSDGGLRDSDNWQKGIPQDEYMKSMFRHFMEVWDNHRNHPDQDRVEALCALLFNVMGYLHEEVKQRG